jgi:hypothetical protein
MSRKSVRGFATQDMLHQCLERGFDKIKTCFAPGKVKRDAGHRASFATTPME